MTDTPHLDALPDADSRPRVCPKGETRVEHKLAKQAALKKADKQARDDAWKRCGYCCEDCGVILKREGDLLHRAHFHHVEGRRKLVYRVLCPKCHFPGPSGAHRGWK